MGETTVKNILINLLPVLDYVHSMGIIHRDIKPDNIILRRQDGLPVLIDFGAVKETMGTVVTTQGNPTSSIVIGTPGFMPSEQAAGKPIRSSDLYSLGLTAIYALTGKQPQDLQIDQDTGEILWHSYAVNLSSKFVAVLDKTIRWHPRERYSTASAMLNALQSGATQIPPTIPSPQPSVPSTQPLQQQIISSTITSPPPIKKKAQQQHNQQTEEIDWNFLALCTTSLLGLGLGIFLIFVKQ
jgi:serine/threonine-protein kinase